MSERVCIDCGGPLPLTKRASGIQRKRCDPCRDARNKIAIERGQVKYRQTSERYKDWHRRYQRTWALNLPRRNDIYCADCLTRLNDQTCWCNVE